MVVRRLLILFLLAGLASLVAACGASDGDRGAGALVTGDIAPRDDDDEEPESVLGPPSAPTQSTVPPAFEPLEAPPPAAADAGPTVDSEPAPPEPASPAPPVPPPSVPEVVIEGEAIVAADLEPGRYATTAFEPRLSFELDDGWSGLQEDLADYFVIFHGPNDDFSMTFINPDNLGGLIDPEQAYEQEPPAAELIDPAGEDFEEFLLASPWLSSSEPVPLSLGRYVGVEFDSLVESGYENVFCAGDCVLLFRTSDGGVFGSDVGYRERATIIDVDGRDLVVLISAPDEQFNDFAPRADEVLASLIIEGSALPEPPAPPEPPPAPGTAPAPAPAPPPAPPEPEEPPVFDPGIELPPPLEA